MKWIVVMACMAACLPAASAGQFDAAEATIRAQLLDPQSAQFTDVRNGRQDGVVCGMVNAKNRMGGYVGPHPFIVAASGHGSSFTPPRDAAFRDFWWMFKNGQSSPDAVAERISEISVGCSLTTQWNALCAAPDAQLHASSFCEYFGKKDEAKNLLNALANRYGN